MFTWLLTKPAIVLDLVLGGILIAFGLYFWLAHREITQLTQQVTEQAIQVQQNESTIKQLDSRLLLVQQLNDNFNKSINVIRAQQSQNTSALTTYSLHSQSLANPKQAEVFINARIQKIVTDLNTLSHTK